jgi:hypothetical protein
MSVSSEHLPALLEITKEYATMANEGHSLQEMTLLPSENDPLLWNGLWFVHEGYCGRLGVILQILMTLYRPVQRSDSQVQHYLPNELSRERATNLFRDPSLPSTCTWKWPFHW